MDNRATRITPASYKKPLLNKKHQLMKKNLPLYLYGAVLIATGFFLLFSDHFTFQTIKITLGSMLIVGAIVAFFRALSKQRKQVEFSYHEIHALAMLAYGILVLVFANTIEMLFYFSSFLTFFYAFSEIIFCTWLFNLGEKVVYKIIFIRVVLGLIVGGGTAVIMNYNAIPDNFDIKGFGPLFVIIGVNILLYVPVMKKEKLAETDNNATTML